MQKSGSFPEMSQHFCPWLESLKFFSFFVFVLYARLHPSPGAKGEVVGTRLSVTQMC